MASSHWLVPETLASVASRSEQARGSRRLAPSGGVSSSVCALLSDNNPNHFSPMLSPPARSGRYTTSAVFAFLAVYIFLDFFVLFSSSFLFFSPFFKKIFLSCSCMANLVFCLCPHLVWNFHVCIIWAILHLWKRGRKKSMFCCSTSALHTQIDELRSERLSSLPIYASNHGNFS